MRYDATPMTLLGTSASTAEPKIRRPCLVCVCVLGEKILSQLGFLMSSIDEEIRSAHAGVQIETIKTPKTVSFKLRKYYAAAKQVSVAQKEERKCRSVTARSFEEALKETRLSSCTDLDFTHHVQLSSNAVKDLQGRILYIQEQKSKKKPVTDAGKTDEECVSELRQIQSRAIAIFEAVKDNDWLEALRVDGKELGEASFCTLADSLQTNRSLLILDISSNYATARAAEQLGFALRWHCLQELYIDFNFLGNLGVDALCNSLQGNAALRLLSVRGNNIGPEFPQSILWLLTPRPLTASDIVYNGPKLFEGSLRTLHLDFNQVQDLPIRLGNVANLDVTFSENPICHPPAEVLAKGWKHTWGTLRNEWKEHEIWHEEQTRLHNLALKQNSTLPKWMHAKDYDGVTAEDF